MQEIGPAVLDRSSAGGLLAPGLVEKDQISPIVELPGEGPLGKLRFAGEGRAGRIFAQTGRVHDQRPGGEAVHDRVGHPGLRDQIQVEGNPAIPRRVEFAQMIQPGRIPIGDMDSGRSIGPVRRPAGWGFEPDGGPTRPPQDRRFGAGSPPMAFGQKRPERETAGHLVERAGEKAAMALVDAAHFPKTAESGSSSSKRSRQAAHRSILWVVTSAPSERGSRRMNSTAAR